eukprot:GHVQ01013073.1.p1 GENE.GHVQ01013073.1~~GHVQ01013073.1.p1  ORF type:complete len:1060 (-),score=100.84 GHVQ01013073.1:419-3598(-)
MAAPKTKSRRSTSPPGASSRRQVTGSSHSNTTTPISSSTKSTKRNVGTRSRSKTAATSNLRDTSLPGRPPGAQPVPENKTESPTEEREMQRSTGRRLSGMMRSTESDSRNRTQNITNDSQLDSGAVQDKSKYRESRGIMATDRDSTEWKGYVAANLRDERHYREMDNDLMRFQDATNSVNSDNKSDCQLLLKLAFYNRLKTLLRDLTVGPASEDRLNRLADAYHWYRTYHPTKENQFHSVASCSKEGTVYSHCDAAGCSESVPKLDFTRTTANPTNNSASPGSTFYQCFNLTYVSNLYHAASPDVTPTPQALHPTLQELHKRRLHRTPSPDTPAEHAAETQSHCPAALPTPSSFHPNCSRHHMSTLSSTNTTVRSNQFLNQTRLVRPQTSTANNSGRARLCSRPSTASPETLPIRQEGIPSNPTPTTPLPSKSSHPFGCVLNSGYREDRGGTPDQVGEWSCDKEGGWYTNDVSRPATASTVATGRQSAMLSRPTTSQSSGPLTTVSSRPASRSYQRRVLASASVPDRIPSAICTSWDIRSHGDHSQPSECSELTKNRSGANLSAMLSSLVGRHLSKYITPQYVPDCGTNETAEIEDNARAAADVSVPSPRNSVQCTASGGEGLHRIDKDSPQCTTPGASLETTEPASACTKQTQESMPKIQQRWLAKRHTEVAEARCRQSMQHVMTEWLHVVKPRHEEHIIRRMESKRFSSLHQRRNYQEVDNADLDIPSEEDDEKQQNKSTTKTIQQSIDHESHADYGKPSANAGQLNSAPDSWKWNKIARLRNLNSHLLLPVDRMHHRDAHAHMEPQTAKDQKHPGTCSSPQKVHLTPYASTNVSVPILGLDPVDHLQLSRTTAEKPISLKGGGQSARLKKPMPIAVSVPTLPSPAKTPTLQQLPVPETRGLPMSPPCIDNDGLIHYCDVIEQMSELWRVRTFEGRNSLPPATPKCTLAPAACSLTRTSESSKMSGSSVAQQVHVYPGRSDSRRACDLPLQRIVDQYDPQMKTRLTDYQRNLTTTISQKLSKTAPAGVFHCLINVVYTWFSENIAILIIQHYPCILT